MTMRVVWKYRGHEIIIRWFRHLWWSRWIWSSHHPGRRWFPTATSRPHWWSFQWTCETALSRSAVPETTSPCCPSTKWPMVTFLPLESPCHMWEGCWRRRRDFVRHRPTICDGAWWRVNSDDIPRSPPLAKRASTWSTACSRWFRPGVRYMIQMDGTHLWRTSPFAQLDLDPTRTYINVLDRGSESLDLMKDYWSTLEFNEWLYLRTICYADR